jgi:hypothetical protein
MRVMCAMRQPHLARSGTAFFQIHRGTRQVLRFLVDKMVARRTRSSLLAVSVGAQSMQVMTMLHAKMLRSRMFAFASGLNYDVQGGNTDNETHSNPPETLPR